MKKTLIFLGVVYLCVAIISVVFLFNNFTSLAENNFRFRIISALLICLFSTLPLVVATSLNIEIPGWSRILLCFLFVALSGGSLFLSFKLFGDHEFLYNPNIPYDRFVNSQVNLTSTLWICMIVTMVCMLPILIIKYFKGWSDWISLILIVFSPVIIVAFVAYIAFLLIKVIFGIIGSSSSEYSGSSDYSSRSTEEKPKKIGDGYLDGKGYFREPGESYYDYNGDIRRPGEFYYDSKGEYRHPTDMYYDGMGVLRRPDEPYYDSGGYLRDPNSEHD